MMTVMVPIPDWVIGKNIYIIAGNELIGIMESHVKHEGGEHVQYYGPLRIKPEWGRCNGCGECCTNGYDEVYRIFKPFLQKLDSHKPESDGCIFHAAKGCGLGAFIPFSCIRSIGTHFENCSERLVEVNGGHRL